ncbi:hypothetical protein [Shimazuella kribbensis]|uniref:hypothetical protein n=1 Tax=Shimazuella kribbensis TaxID=139808 RepID=UPI0004049F75|nr:hypothetical protein [Shimazuella kribbensis]
MGWNKLSRGSYIAWSLPIFILPFFAGLGAAVVEPWSDFWWGFTVDFFYVWCGWVFLCAIFGWHNNRFLRLFPYMVMMNITVLLSFVPMWRITNESMVLGVFLLFSHLYLTLFVYIYSKEISSKQYRKRGVKIGLLVSILLPICWMIIVIQQDLFTVRIIKVYGAAICFYFLNIPFVSASIRFREPDWEPPKQNSKSL